MPAWRASSSLIWNRTSQVSVSCVSCAGLSWTVPGYSLTAWLRLVTWVSRVAIVIRWLPTIAAAPILTGLHPVTTSPAPSTTADTLTSLPSTGLRPLIVALLTLCRIQSYSEVSEHRPDDFTAPGQQFGVPQWLPADSIPERLAAAGGRLWHWYEHRTHRGFQHCLRVQALHPDLPGIRQLDR